MNYLKRFVLALLAVVIILPLGANGQKESTGQGASLKPVRILSEVTGGKDPDEQDLWQQAVLKRSGIPIDMTVAAGSDYRTKLTTTLASGEDYDIVYMLSGEFEKLFHMDMFYPLTDMIAQSAVFSDTSRFSAKEWDRIRRDDGQIYGIFNKYEGGRLPLVRSDWMQKLGVKDPVTLEDYHQLLRKFTFGDPDGNGKADTYGLTMKNIYDIQPFMSAMGIGGGYGGGYAQDANGKWYLPWASDKAAAVYDWLAGLYKEGLIDPNFPTNGSSNCREMILSGRAGMMVYWDNWVGLFNQKAAELTDMPNFEIKALVPPRDQNGHTMLTTGQDGLWVILKRSSNKENAFKFLEFLNTRDGEILQTLGIEGHDYTLTDGKYTLTEVGRNHAMDHGVVVPKDAKWVNPIETPKNFVAAQKIVMEYGQPELLRQNSSAAAEIITKYGVQSIMGVMSGAEAVAAMQKDLKAKGYID